MKYHRVVVTQYGGPDGRRRLSRTKGQVADAHLKRQVMEREVVVAVTNGRLDGFVVLTRTFGTWERILCQLNG